MHRIAAYRIHQSLVEKPLTIEKFWPSRNDVIKPKERISMDQDMYEAIKKAHNIK
jgi:hypothetical protein